LTLVFVDFLPKEKSFRRRFLTSSSNDEESVDPMSSNCCCFPLPFPKLTVEIDPLFEELIDPLLWARWEWDEVSTSAKDLPTKLQTKVKNPSKNSSAKFTTKL
jgi:hypothetical protein